MAKRRKRKTARAGVARRRKVRHNPPRHTARRHTKRRHTARHHTARRNPAIVGQITAALKGAGFVVAGKVATGAIAKLLPFGGSSPFVDIAKRAAVALGVGMLARRVTSAQNADLLTIGGLVSPIEALIRTLNIPVVTAALGEDPSDFGLSRMLNAGDFGSYVGDGMGAYVNSGMSGSTDDMLEEFAISGG